MHYVGYAEMAAAVSNAGGLGIITALTVAQPPRGAEALRDEIENADLSRPNHLVLTLLYYQWVYHQIILVLLKL